jgi:hypothetical protein
MTELLKDLELNGLFEEACTQLFIAKNGILPIDSSFGLKVIDNMDSIIKDVQKGKITIKNRKKIKTDGNLVFEKKTPGVNVGMRSATYEILSREVLEHVAKETYEKADAERIINKLPEELTPEQKIHIIKAYTDSEIFKKKCVGTCQFELESQIRRTASDFVSAEDKVKQGHAAASQNFIGGRRRRRRKSRKKRRKSRRKSRRKNKSRKRRRRTRRRRR